MNTTTLFMALQTIVISMVIFYMQRLQKRRDDKRSARRLDEKRALTAYMQAKAKESEYKTRLILAQAELCVLLGRQMNLKQDAQSPLLQPRFSQAYSRLTEALEAYNAFVREAGSAYLFGASEDKEE